MAEQLAADIAANRRGEGKGLDEYQIEVLSHEGRTVYAVPPDKLSILRKDAVWSAYPLDIPVANIQVVPVERIFETGRFIAGK